jgi:adenylosuccinate synthase
LALDPGGGEPLPHLTPTNVGLGGIIGFAAQVAVPPTLELIYATRPYLTRHGAGPLPYEGELDPEELGIKDETNVPNTWQQSLRFAPLDLGALLRRIQLDLRWLRVIPQAQRPKLILSLGITCLDQVENTDFPFYDLNGERQTGVTKFLNECHWILEKISAGYERGRMITCFGEDREDTHDSGELSVQVA